MGDLKEINTSLIFGYLLPVRIFLKLCTIVKKCVGKYEAKKFPSDFQTILSADIIRK